MHLPLQSRLNAFGGSVRYAHSSFAIILIWKRDLIAMLSLSRDCCVALLSRGAMVLSADCECDIF